MQGSALFKATASSFSLTRMNVYELQLGTVSFRYWVSAGGNGPASSLTELARGVGGWGGRGGLCFVDDNEDDEITH